MKLSFMPVSKSNVVPPMIVDAPASLTAYIKPFSMDELDEEEKRKQFMEQQMGYLERVMERGEPPGIA